MKYLLILLFLVCSQTLFGQTFRNDIMDGLYSPSPDGILVRQLTSDTLRLYKLHESKEHFDRVSKALFDSVPELPDIPKRRKRANKVNELIEVNDRRFVLLFGHDSIFTVLNFLKKDIGYEFYSKTYITDRAFLIDSIILDTTEYFTFKAFNLEDLKTVNKLKPLGKIKRKEFKRLLETLTISGERYYEQIKNNESRSMYGTVENNEILVKVLLSLNYNPILKFDEFDKIYRKFNPKE